MRPLLTSSSTGQIRAMWPVLLALLAAVLVPTGCVLWFMTVAMGNERLAMQQRLAEIYRQNLGTVRQRIDAHWGSVAGELEAAAALPPAEAMRRLLDKGIVDAVIIYDAAGAIVFPTVTAPPPEGEGFDPLWELARDQELVQGDHASAAEMYARIAARAMDRHRKAQAIQAEARCRARAGQASAAIDLLAHVLAGDAFRDARDESGRLIAHNALLHALQLITPRGDDVWRAAARDLAGRLEAHDGPAMPLSQRLHLMRQLHALGGPRLPTLDALELTAMHVDAGLIDPPGAGLKRSPAAGIWSLAPHGGRIAALLRDSTIRAAHESILAATAPPAGTRLVLHESGQRDEGADPVLTVSASEHLPDWRLSLHLDAPDPSAAAAEQRIALYLWTGGLGIALITGLTLIAGGFVGRQLRLTRLKNDLIATVSHELKTPLASMRALVETLLAGRCTDERQVKEYLTLIARENERLSRLIDNFLTFSRMERNHRAFQFVPVSVRRIVELAEAHCRDRFAAPGCRLDVEIADDLPSINGDREALVTVLLNLLDNAWKYTGERKLVRLRAFIEGGDIRIEVADNGIGLSRRSMRWIFDRFYQVDQTLSRQAGGCGLGLSIVRFIVENHGGTVSVQSQPGQGSTFCVTLPAAIAATEQMEQSHAG